MKCIEIQAKEWFDKTYGNSYFAAKVYVDDKLIGCIPFQYGYGQHYERTAVEILKDNEFIKQPVLLWQFCRDNDIKLVSNKQENCKKRDVKSFGENK